MLQYVNICYNMLNIYVIQYFQELFINFKSIKQSCSLLGTLNFKFQIQEFSRISMRHTNPAISGKQRGGSSANYYDSYESKHEKGIFCSQIKLQIYFAQSSYYYKFIQPFLVKMVFLKTSLSPICNSQVITRLKHISF